MILITTYQKIKIRKTFRRTMIPEIRGILHLTAMMKVKNLSFSVEVDCIIDTANVYYAKKEIWNIKQVHLR